MIRSILLNLIVLAIGLVFLAAGSAYLTEDVSRAGWRGVFNTHALTFGSINLAVGLWCTVGAINNLRARRTSPREPLPPYERVAASLIGLVALAIAGVVFGASWAFYLLFVVTILAVPAVVFWGTIAKWRASRR